MKPDFWATLANYIASAIFVGGGVIYFASRRYSNDRRTDKLADATVNAEVGAIERLQMQLDSEREHTADLGKTIDRLSAERNQAVEAAGMLKGKVEALQNQVEHLSAQVEELQRENEELHALVVDSAENVKALELAIRTLLSNLSIRECAMLPECPKKDWKP